jgi:hypothetical protein
MLQTSLNSLNFGQKSLLAGELNDRHPFWNSIVSNPSCVNQLNLLHLNNFKISAPYSPTHYSPAGKGDTLDIILHKHVRLSEVIVSDILDSDHLTIVFHLLDHIRTRNRSGPVDKFTDCERFQKQASELISPKIQINSGEEAHKATRDITASISSAYRLSTSKITPSDLNKDLPGLESLLKLKWGLRKLVASNPGSNM